MAEGGSQPPNQADPLRGPSHGETEQSPLGGPRPAQRPASSDNNSIRPDVPTTEAQPPRQVRTQPQTRWRPTATQKELLLKELELNPYPTVETKAQLANELGVSRSQISKWFQHRRETLVKNSGFVGVRQRERRTDAQLEILNAEFDAEPYPHSSALRDLAASLCLTDKQVRLWFKHRRQSVAKAAASRTFESTGASTDAGRRGGTGRAATGGETRAAASEANDATASAASSDGKDLGRSARAGNVLLGDVEKGAAKIDDGACASPSPTKRKDRDENAARRDALNTRRTVVKTAEGIGSVVRKYGREEAGGGLEGADVDDDDDGECDDDDDGDDDDDDEEEEEREYPERYRGHYRNPEYRGVSAGERRRNRRPRPESHVIAEGWQIADRYKGIDSGSGRGLSSEKNPKRARRMRSPARGDLSDPATARPSNGAAEKGRSAGGEQQPPVSRLSPDGSPGGNEKEIADQRPISDVREAVPITHVQFTALTAVLLATGPGVPPPHIANRLATFLELPTTRVLDWFATSTDNRTVEMLHPRGPTMGPWNAVDGGRWPTHMPPHERVPLQPGEPLWSPHPPRGNGANVVDRGGLNSRLATGHKNDSSPAHGNIHPNCMHCRDHSTVGSVGGAVHPFSSDSMASEAHRRQHAQLHVMGHQYMPPALSFHHGGAPVVMRQSPILSHPPPPHSVSQAHHGIPPGAAVTFPFPRDHGLAFRPPALQQPGEILRHDPHHRSPANFPESAPRTPALVGRRIHERPASQLDPAEGARRREEFRSRGSENDDRAWSDRIHEQHSRRVGSEIPAQFPADTPSSRTKAPDKATKDKDNANS